MSDINQILKTYKSVVSDSNIIESIDKIKEKAKKNETIDVFKKCFNSIDLTSLNHTDTEENIKKMIEKVNNFKANYPEMPMLKTICVYPSMVETVKKTLTENIGITSVSVSETKV